MRALGVDWVFGNLALFVACLAVLPVIGIASLGSLLGRFAGQCLAAVNPLPGTPRTDPSTTPAPSPSG